MNWTPGQDSNPRDLGLLPSALPLSHPELGGVGYGIRTRVSGVKVRSPRPLADNPTQDYAGQHSRNGAVCGNRTRTLCLEGSNASR